MNDTIDTNMTAWLIVGAQIFDGSGCARVPGDVLVENERITRIAAHIDPGDYEGVSVIDARGATLMPGMIDGHTHLGFGSTVQHRSYERESIEESVLLAAHAARTMLDHGFTSAYSGGNRIPAGDVALRKAIAEGWMAGPRLRAASFEAEVVSTDETATSGDTRGSRAEGLRRFVTDMADCGVDIIKIPLTGESALVARTSRVLEYTNEEVAAAAVAARERNLWLSAHAHSSEGIQMALRHGFRAIYHATFADDEAIDALAAARDRVFVAPTPGVLYALMHEATNPPDDGMETRESIESLKRVVPKMLDAGVRIVPGGDYGFPFNPVGKNARDLELFVEWFGFTPNQALRCATEFGGQIMDMGHELGLIREGYIADLLLVEGDPTSDVRVLQDTSQLSMIMQAGRPHKLSSSRRKEQRSTASTTLTGARA